MSEPWLSTATSSQPGQPETRADRGLRSAQVRKRRCGTPLHTNTAPMQLLNQQDLKMKCQISLVIAVAGMNFMSRWCPRGSSNWKNRIKPQIRVKSREKRELERQPKAVLTWVNKTRRKIIKSIDNLGEIWSLHREIIVRRYKMSISAALYFYSTTFT